MIIVNILGGLGNQLFQYAAARRLAMHHKTTLKLDITGFAHYTWHLYSLKPLSMDVEFATQEEIDQAKYGGSPDLLKQSLKPGEKLRSPEGAVFSESFVFPYNPAILRTKPDVYLQGYWQSEKYFLDIADIIRGEARVKMPQEEASKRIGDEIQGTTAVSLHIRRGNYVSNTAVNTVHGTCGVEYYHACAAYLAERVNDPHFFVFSDDPAWARENIKLPHPTTFVTNNDAARDYEDLRLMSLCRHFIIANSSFSWWSAWLGGRGHPQKVVLAPKKWFNDPKVDTSDLIPAGWMRM